MSLEYKFSEAKDAMPENVDYTINDIDNNKEYSCQISREALDQRIKVEYLT